MDVIQILVFFRYNWLGTFSGQDPETEEAEACKDRKTGTSGSIFFCGRGGS